jgi:hypothetical protein
VKCWRCTLWPLCHAEPSFVVKWHKGSCTRTWWQASYHLSHTLQACLDLVIFEIRQVLWHFSHSPSPFQFGYFSKKLSHLCLGRLELWSSCTFPVQLGWQACATTPSFYWLRRGFASFCPGWLWTTIYLLSSEDHRHESSHLAWT